MIENFKIPKWGERWEPLIILQEMSEKINEVIDEVNKLRSSFDEHHSQGRENFKKVMDHIEQIEGRHRDRR